MIAIGHQGSLGPFAGADDRVADRDLDLTAETVTGRRVEILRRQDLPLKLLEIDAGSVWIDRAGLTSVPQPDSHFLFDLLGADFLHPCKVGQLALGKEDFKPLVALWFITFALVPGFWIFL
jgi:hypothetical protein